MSAGRVVVAADVLAGALPQALGGRPLLCRWPAGRGVSGAIVFCHGLGSNGGDYAALSQCWAAHGYLAIHPTFDDSIAVVAAAEPELGLDPEADLSGWTELPALRARMHEILHAPERWLGRAAAAGAVLDALPRILAETCGGAPPPVAIAGHSFGAFTAQLLAGAEIDLPDAPGASFVDPRCRAAILLSAQGRDQQGLRDGSWARMRGPALIVTGTLDRGANGGGWEWKAEPFTEASAPEQYLAVLEGGDHFLGGFDAESRRPAVPAQAAAVRQLTLQFLDSALLGDLNARAALRATADRIGDCRLSFRCR